MSDQQRTKDTSPGQTWGNGYYRLVLAVIVIAALICFLAAELTPANWGALPSHILRDLGIALIVSFVIIVTIEQKSRGELNQTVQTFLVRTHENLFQTILGVQFPKAMFDFVRERLMKEPVFRTGTEIHYTIRSLRESSSVLYGFPTVIVDFVSIYVVNNLSDKEQRHPLRFFVEKAGPGSPLNEPKLIVDGQTIDADKLAKADSGWTDRPGLRRFEYTLMMSPNASHTVEMRHSMTKLIADSECWRSLYACDGLRLTITHPADLVVMADGMHTDELVTIQQNEVSLVGKLDRPLFPANGFLFWWHPREVAAEGKDA
jgi:hypothetical protein